MNRKLIYKLHKWLGLITGMLLILISVSGSLLVFRKPLDHLTRPPSFRLRPAVRKASWNVLVSNATQAYGKAHLDALDLASEADEPVRITLADDTGPLTVFVDPQTGHVLGDDINNPPLSHYTYALHVNLFVGTPGAVIVLVLGAALALLAVSGLFVYRGVWRHPFRLRHKGRRKIRVADFHRIAGLWSLLFSLMFGITGVLAESRCDHARQR